MSVCSVCVCGDRVLTPPSPPPSPHIQVSTSGFVTEERASEIEKFFAENPWPMADRIVKQNCEAICLNAKWLERDKEDVKQWLSSL